MSAIMDFDLWLEAVDLEGDEGYWLFTAVQNLENTGMFACWENERVAGQYFVKANHIDELLLLASEKAREAFLARVENDYAGDDYDAESQYAFNQAMAGRD